MIRVIVYDDTRESRARALSSSLVWVYRNKYSDENTDELEFTARHEECLIKFAIDKFVGAKYFILRADKGDGTLPEQLKAIEEGVLQKILTRPGAVTVLNWDTLKQQFDQSRTDDEKAHATIRLALDSVDFDPERMKFFTEQLMRDDPPISESIIVGVGYMGWPQWKDVLQDFANKTKHPDLKRKAERMLSGFNLNP